MVDTSADPHTQNSVDDLDECEVDGLIDEIERLDECEIDTQLKVLHLNPDQTIAHVRKLVAAITSHNVVLFEQQNVTTFHSGKSNELESF